jgi:hypothetical protein
VSETSEGAPRLYKFMGKYGQVRVRNTHPTMQLRSPWICRGVKQYAVLSSADCHPADIAHMLQAVTVAHVMRDGFVAREDQPMLVELPAS